MSILLSACNLPMDRNTPAENAALSVPHSKLRIVEGSVSCLTGTDLSRLVSILYEMRD